MKKRLFLLVVAIISICQVALANSYYAKVTATVSPTSAAGTVYVSNKQNPTSGQSTTTIETSVSGGNITFYINAIPNDAYVFKEWIFTDGSGSFDNSTSAATSVTVKASNTDGKTSNYIVQATFVALPKFYFKVTVTADEGGSVSTTPPTRDLPTFLYGENADSKSASTRVTFKATPNVGYVFDKWVDAGGKTVSEAAEFTKTLEASSKDQNKPTTFAYTAKFKKLPTFPIQISANAGTGGSVSTTPASGQLPTVLYGENADSKSESTKVTFTATPNTGYAFVKWVDAGGTTVSTDAVYNATLTATDQNNTTTFAYTAVFGELPKFYYVFDFEIDTEYADGSDGTALSGKVTYPSDTQWIYGATPDATEATVTENELSLLADPFERFTFTKWTNAAGQQVSTQTSYTPNDFKISSKDENNPTKVVFTAHFKEYPNFFIKLSLTVKEYLAKTNDYNTGQSKGNAASWDVTLTDEGYLMIPATTADQKSASKTIKLSALEANGFGLRGWSTSLVSATNIETGPYESIAREYTKTFNTSFTSRTAADSSPINIYAYYQEFPIFYFKPLTEVLPMENGVTDPGTASVEPSGILESYPASLYTTEGTASVTFRATANIGYKFGGWYKIQGTDTTLVSTYNPYTAKIKSTSKKEAEPTETKLYAQFLTSMLSIHAEDIVLNVESDGWLNITVTPADAWKSYIITSEKPSLVYVDNSGHCRSNATPGSTTIKIQGVTTDGRTPAELYTEVTAIVRVKCKKPTISFSPSDDGTKALMTLTRSSDDTLKVKYDNQEIRTTLYWTTDTTGTWTRYVDGTPAVIEDLDATVYAKSVMLKPDGTPDPDYTESNITKAKYVKPQVEKPTVVIDNQGVTFSSSTPGTITYYYTVNDDAGGTDPTATSYTGTWTTGGAKIKTIGSEKYIRVIGVKAGYIDSEVTERQYIFTSGINGNTVILNDFEDHTWTYYAGVPSDVDGGNYNTSYLGKLYSPNPRNVKITYKGNGGAVSIDESETEFIYYKTLEESSTAGEYKYQVISNPFSKRPTGKGFGGWKITGGATYIKGKNANDILALDEEITFESLPYPSVNCTSAEIELTATWVNANITTLNTTSDYTYSVTGGNYETNILVISSNYKKTIKTSSPVTIMMVEPDGTADYRSSKTFSGNITPNNSGVTKIEFANWHYNGSFYTYHKSMTIGRGMDMTSNFATEVYGNPNTSGSTSGNLTYTIKIESGKTGSLNLTNSSESSINQIIYSGTLSAKCILGCDYDRASGENSKMNLAASGTNGSIYGGQGLKFSGSGNQNNLTFDWTIKSGTIMSSILGDADGGTESLYMGSSIYDSNGYSLQYFGRRRMTIEGGDIASIAGGVDDINRSTYLVNDGDWTVMIRMKGGHVRGSIYGAAAQAGSAGDRLFIFTGGTINGWVAGGANGTASDGGVLDGTSRLYVGGNTSVNSNGAKSVINRAIGGNVFGAGCGYSTSSSSGQVSNGTNVVIADNAYIERGVYGGGSYGYCTTNKNANLYITGGHVAGVNGGVSGTSYSASITGGVFGGACQNKGGSSKIYMTGGLVESGLYGGSNSSGTLSGSVEIHINGGQVGTDASHTANVHGGGYGSSTVVSGNVDLSIGTYNETTATASGNAVIYGDVYGGSALGTVNDAASDHTNVTLAGGTIYGSLYGGALGNASTAANVTGPVTVKVYGGSVKKTDEDGANGSGSVYGANNINGAPQNTVKVEIHHTDPHNNGFDGDAGTDDDEYAIFRVFGGGNQAPYTYTSGPSVTVFDCDNSIGSVYGGGNQAKVNKTNVTIYGGNIIGRVFGGCRGSANTTQSADVNNDVNLNIYGGRILKAFGGNDSGGEVMGDINIQVSQTGYTASTCPIVMDYLYGGGNNADSKTANMNILYADSIGNVFGGACSANMTGSIDLKIVAGKIGTVFGGNDQAGTINGNQIKVTVNWLEGTNGGVDYSFENNSLGSVYGGGNVADFGGSTLVKVLNAHLTGSVYGGGKKADIGDSTCVVIGDWTDAHNVVIEGDVYGGGDKAAVRNSTRVTVNDCGTIIEGDVYGGGNAAAVGEGNSGKTTVTIWGGTMNRVFGGGHGYPTADPPIGADIYGSTQVNFFGGSTNGIYGGSNSVGNITESSNVYLDKGLCPDADEFGNSAKEECEINLQEVYGAGNEAFMEGESKLVIGCIDDMGEIYGGSRKADINNNIVLTISSGTFRRVFGGNNEGGCINGSITVNVEETGCHPVVIDELYGCGNQASYSIYGYDDDGKPVASGDAKYGNPKINIISCTSIGSVYGGGLGEAAVVYGSPNVHVDMTEGRWYNRVNNEWGNKLGTINTVFGGGNAAKVVGNTQVEIGTEGRGVNISDNIYGGGNQAEVTGSTSVTIGR